MLSASLRRYKIRSNSIKPPLASLFESLANAAMPEPLARPSVPSHGDSGRAASELSLTEATVLSYPSPIPSRSAPFTALRQYTWQLDRAAPRKLAREPCRRGDGEAVSTELLWLRTSKQRALRDRGDAGVMPPAHAVTLSASLRRHKKDACDRADPRNKMYAPLGSISRAR